MSATLKLKRNAPVMEVVHRGTFDILVDGRRVTPIFLMSFAAPRWALKLRPE